MPSETGSNIWDAGAGNDYVWVPDGNGGGGGGDGGGENPNPDPGHGLWITDDNRVFVHDRGYLSELFVPRCIPSQYANCRWGGSGSRYDSLLTGQTWAMRLPVGKIDVSPRSYSFLVYRAETGEASNYFDAAISTTPGDFDVDAECKGTIGIAIDVYDPNSGYTPSFGMAGCKIRSDTMYYLNVTPHAGVACGTGANGCRYRIVLPAGFNYADN